LFLTTLFPTLLLFLLAILLCLLPLLLALLALGLVFLPPLFTAPTSALRIRKIARSE
jgi:hypothetical protein